MTRSFAALYFAAALFLLAMTACSPARKQLLGDPESPYPLHSPPRIGDMSTSPTGTLGNAWRR